jgi:hypothetical protein
MTKRSAIYLAKVTRAFDGLRVAERVEFYRSGSSWVVLTKDGRALTLTTSEAQAHMETVRSWGRPMETIGTAAYFRRGALEFATDKARTDRMALAS